eukprot:SAG11_NODE_943_length_6434_cov_3.493133_7_plen_320_part_00
MHRGDFGRECCSDLSSSGYRFLHPVAKPLSSDIKYHLGFHHIPRDMASIAQRSDELRRPQKLIPRNCAACGKAEVDHLPLIVAGGQSLVHTFRTSHGTWYCEYNSLSRSIIAASSTEFSLSAASPAGDYCLKKGTSQNDGEHLAKKPITDTGGRLIRAMTISVPTTAEGALNAGADQSAAARAEPGAEQSDNLVTDNGPFVGLTELQAQQRVAEGAGPEPEQPGQPGQQFLLGSTVTRFTQVTTESFESLDEAMVAWKKTSNVKVKTVLCAPSVRTKSGEVLNGAHRSLPCRRLMCSAASQRRCPWSRSTERRGRWRTS